MVDGQDLTILSRYVSDQTVPESFDYNAKIRSDVDMDGQLSVNDVKLLRNKISKDISLPVKMGDVNEDGVIDIKDATLIQDYSASSATLSERQKLLADVNVDDTVSVRDASVIQQFVAGTITSLPVVEGKEIVAPTEPSGTTEPAADPKEDSDQVVNVENTALKVPLVILTISFSLIIAGIVITSAALLRKEEQQK